MKCLWVTKIVKEKKFEGMRGKLEAKECFQRQSFTKYLKLTLPTRQIYVPRTCWGRPQKASCGRFHMFLYDVPIDALRTSSTDVLRTLKYDVPRTSQCNVLKTFPYCPMCNTMGLPLPTSWGLLLQMLWERPHTV